MVSRRPPVIPANKHPQKQRTGRHEIKCSVPTHLAPGDPTKQPFLLPLLVNKRQIASAPCSSFPCFLVSAISHRPCLSASSFSLLPHATTAEPVCQHLPSFLSRPVPLRLPEYAFTFAYSCFSHFTSPRVRLSFCAIDQVVSPMLNIKLNPRLILLPPST